jgi:hypothetical protein
MVECEDKVMGRMFAKVAYQFMSVMVEVSVACRFLFDSFLS